MSNLYALLQALLQLQALGNVLTSYEAFPLLLTDLDATLVQSG
jgi:hypothetical protein